MSASASKKKRKELDEQGLSPRAIAEKKAKEQKQKLLRNILIVVLCVAVALAVIFAVISLVNRPEPPSYDTSAAVATVGDEKITVPVYDIFYNTNASSLYNYGYSYFITKGTPLSEQNNVFGGEGTMEDFFKENAANAIQTVYNYYIQAKADGYELTKEQKDTIDEELDALKEAASNYGFRNLNKFLDLYYGEGVDLDAYKTYLEVSAYYSGYYNKLQEEFKPTAEELQAAYDEDPGKFDFVSFTYQSTSAESTTLPAEGESEGEGEGEEGEGEEGEGEEGEAETETPTTTIYTEAAKADAKEKAEGYLTEMPEDARSETYNKTNVTSYFNEEIANWLFDAERKEGDAKVFVMNEDETSYYTVRFDSRDTNEYCRVNANILTITKDKEDAEIKEGEQTAKEKLDALLSAVKDGMTDEEFSEAASALGYTVSSTSVTHTYSIEEIRTWLYDASRKAGDLFTEYSSDSTYYVVRYVSTDEVTYRDSLIKDSLWSEKTEAIAALNEIKFVDEMMQYANTDLTFNDTSSSES